MRYPIDDGTGRAWGTVDIADNMVEALNFADREAGPTPWALEPLFGPDGLVGFTFVARPAGDLR